MQVRDGNGAITIAKALLIVRLEGEGSMTVDSSENTTGSSGNSNTQNSNSNQSTSSNNQNTNPSQGNSDHIDVSGGKPLPNAKLPVRNDSREYLYREYIPANNVGTGRYTLTSNPVFEVHKAFGIFLGRESNTAYGTSSIQPLGGASNLSSANLPINAYQASGNSGQGNTLNNIQQESPAAQNTGEISFSSDPAIAKLQKQYAQVSIEPPYPGESPFTDIDEEDWFFPLAVQAYRDGLVAGPTFY